MFCLMVLLLLQKFKEGGKPEKRPQRAFQCEGEIGRGKQTNIPPLREHNAEEEANEQNAGANPSIGRVRSDFVKITLI